MKHITEKEMLNRYELTAGHDTTMLVFHCEKIVYMTLIHNLVDANIPVTFNERINNNGRVYTELRLNLKQMDCVKLRDKGAKKLGTVTEFFADMRKNENRGEYVERVMIEKYHGIPSRKNSAYYTKGDCNIAGMEVQIKWENGTVGNIDTINRQYSKLRKG